MKRCLAFAGRNAKELLRDPLTLVFTVAMPVALLGLMSLIYQSTPVATFAPQNFAPGMAVFSLSFLSLFTGQLIANDRSSAFLMRVFASPMTAANFMLAYTLPLLCIAVLQMLLCFGAAVLFGLPATPNILLAVAVLLPTALLFIGLGILLGSLFNAKQGVGISNILIQVAALLGGTWFDLSLLGGVAQNIGNALPFAHALEASRAALAGDLGNILPHMVWVVCYAMAVFTAATLAFDKRMKNGKQ